MCGDYLAHTPAALWHTARGWWPLLLTVALAVLATRLVWTWWRRRTWRDVAGQAVWLEVVPPVTATPAATLANPFPAGIQQPAGASAGLGTFAGQAINFMNPEIKSAYSVRWNLSLQYQVTPNLVMR